MTWRLFSLAFLAGIIIAFNSDVARPSDSLSNAPVQSSNFSNFVDVDGVEVKVIVNEKTTNRPPAIIVPGSGNLDIDGSGAFNMGGSIYKLLSDELSEKSGISTIRYRKDLDKDKSYNIHEKKETLNLVIDHVKEKLKYNCVWLIGHSEGAVVSAVTAIDRSDICGIVFLAAPAQKFGDILRKQFGRPEFPMSITTEAGNIISNLESGIMVEDSSMSPLMRLVFSKNMQESIMETINIEPTFYYSQIKMPTLILHGNTDIQVEIKDAESIHSLIKKSKFIYLLDTSHFFRLVIGKEIVKQNVINSDSNIPVNPVVISSIVEFLQSHDSG